MPWGRHHRGPRHLSPAVMAALALLCLASQTSALAHVLFVAHAACAEHGELIDLRAGDARHHTAPPSNGPSLSTLDRTPRAHSHDHCTVATTRSDRPRPTCPPALALGTGPALAVSLDHDARHPAPLDALDVAPKSSPPA